MKTRDTLELRLERNQLDQMIIAHQYSAYPLRLSGIFRLEGEQSDGAYFYLLNTSPGLLAQDRLSLNLNLAANTTMYLTDQAATKVHPMPKTETKATVNWNIVLEAGACLEIVPEPVILFADAAFEQTTKIKLHPQGSLFWSEIILPGRLARGESYDFRYYYNRLEIHSLQGELWFRDAAKIFGQDNPFKHHDLFASEPILANLIIVQSQLDLGLLTQKIVDLATADFPELLIASSLLPDDKGLLVRIMASKTRLIKQYINYVLNCIRSLSDRPALPYIPK